jgi:hypothetical protein
MIVAAAIQEVEDLQALLSIAVEKADGAMGMIAQAVGADSLFESARNAREFTAAVRERLSELIGMLHAAIEELVRYGGGF